ncbi:MAG TPA: sigma-70 family RNA polymerase sigma factor [Planctomycetota bacterium]|nr:sigma-70 family RNA polymerase sigma factor [Planctomycetota bacterium]
MKPDSVEAAFARFCEGCDPADMAEVFDRSAGELLPLARRLTHGRGEADDLIQETFLAAIEHRESYDPARPLMPWLIGILVRQASAARRRSRREVDPERLDSRNQTAPDDDVQANEFQTIVMEALSRLSRHDRDVLMPLLFDGKRAAQIARELGSRPDTIRMRIHRGLDRLRRILPAGLAMPAMFSFGRGWSDVRANVLSRAAQLKHGPVPIPVATGAGSATGLWVALALAGSLALIWSVAGPSSPSTEPGETPPLSSVLTQGRSSTPSEVRRVEDGAARERVADVASVPASTATARESIRLSGSIRGLDPSEFAGAHIEVAGLGPDPIDWRETAVLQGNSEFEVDVTRLAALGARRLLVRADHPDHAPAEVRIELGNEPRLSAGTLDLLAARIVTGRVVALDGAPLGAATVGLFSIRAGSQDVLPLEVAQTGTDGSFRLRSPSNGPHAVIAFRGDLRPASHLVDLSAGTSDAGSLRLEPGLTIAGRVQAPAAMDLTGTRVRCEAAPTPGERRLRLVDRRFVRIDNRFECATVLVSCDAQGRFAVNGLGSQACDLSVLELGGVEAIAPGMSLPNVAPGASGVRAPRFDVKLELPWSELRFELAAGEESVAQEVIAVDIAQELGASASGMKPASLRLRPHAGVPVRLQVRPGLRYQIALLGCTHLSDTSFSLEAPSSGQSLAIALDPRPIGARSTLVLDLLGLDHTPGDRIGLGFFPSRDDTGPPLFERNARLGSDNQARFADLPPGAWHTRVRLGGTYARSFGFGLPAVLELDLAPGQTSERSLRSERGGRARLIVRSATGAPVSTEARLFDAAGREHALDCIAVEPESAHEITGRIVFNSPNELGPLPVGSWRLELNALWHEPLTIPFQIELDRVSELSAQLRAR